MRPLVEVKLGAAFQRTLVLLLSLAVSGCDREPASVEGGTIGVLRCGASAIGDLELTLHRRTGTAIEPVGFAITAADGSFKLLQPGAAGPLFLSPGDYCCTLESAGAPVQIPRAYTKPETTPLKVSYQAGQEEIEIVGPYLKLR